MTEDQLENVLSRLAGEERFLCVVCGEVIPLVISESRGRAWPRWNYVHETMDLNGNSTDFPDCRKDWQYARGNHRMLEARNERQQQAVAEGKSTWHKPTEQELARARRRS